MRSSGSRFESRRQQMADNDAPGQDARKEIAAFTLRVCKPLYWHDRNLAWPKKVRGASCFIVRFPAKLMMITADHVYASYLEVSLVFQRKFASFIPPSGRRRSQPSVRWVLLRTSAIEK
jgi:hypothetical protein